MIKTNKNMKRAMESVTKNANPGDLVYIHYSGHGARAKTVMPELKGERGYDEVWVPTDICIGGGYLRDIEIAVLLLNMVKSKLVVTITLDCCSAGSGIYGGKSTEILYDMLHQLPTLSNPPNHCGNISMHSLSRTPGYELFAACCRRGLASESLCPDNIGEWHGRLSYWLLETLKSSHGKITHGMLHQAVCD